MSRTPVRSEGFSLTYVDFRLDSNVYHLGQTHLACAGKIPALQRAGLIVTVLVTGVWLGWIVWSARIEREAVAAIRKTDGNIVLYDWQWKSGESVDGEPWTPRWLVDAFGVDYFGGSPQPP